MVHLVYINHRTTLEHACRLAASVDFHTAVRISEDDDIFKPSEELAPINFLRKRCEEIGIKRIGYFWGGSSRAGPHFFVPDEITKMQVMICFKSEYEICLKQYHDRFIDDDFEKILIRNYVYSIQWEDEER